MVDLQLLESGALRRGLLLQRDVLDAQRQQAQLQQACAQLQAELQVAELRLQQALMKQQVGIRAVSCSRALRVMPCSSFPGDSSAGHQQVCKQCCCMHAPATEHACPVPIKP